MVSGMSGCGKKKYAKQLALDLGNLHLVDQSKFYKKDYDVRTLLKNGVEVQNISSYDAFDWSAFNKEVNKHKSEGVVVVGSALITDKLDFKPDFHIHLNIPKDVCAKRRDEYLEHNKDKYPEEHKHIGETTKLKINQVIYPFYLQTHKDSKYDLFLKTEELTDDEIYDKMFDETIKQIQKVLATSGPAPAD